MAPHHENQIAMTAAGLNLIQQALSIYDSDLRLAVYNRRFAEMFGLPPELSTRGASFQETIRFLVERGEYGEVDDISEAVAARVEAARAFQPHYMERRRPNGRWISVEGAPLTTGGWITVYTDITEIKLQEGLLRARSAELSEQVLANAERLSQANRELAATNAALQETKRELTEMEARTRLTTEMMPAHIAHVGRDLRYTYSNRRLSSVMPGPGRPQSIIGLTGREALGEAAFRKIAPYLHRALEGEPAVFEFADEESGRRIRAAFTPDQTSDGPINGVYILSMDVTEEVQARSALMQTRKRELAAQLTSGLAHDFANLLTIILGLQGRLERMALPDGAQDIVAATVVSSRNSKAASNFPQNREKALTQLSGAFSCVLPFARSVEEGFNFGQRFLVKGALGSGFGQNIPPRAQVVELHTMFGQAFFGALEDSIVKDHRSMAASCPGFADCIDK